MDSADAPSVGCGDCNRKESMSDRYPNRLRLPSHSRQLSLATSPHLSLKLKESLGNEAGTELIGLVDKAADDISALRGDIAELRHQTELGFARIDVKFAEIGANFAQVDTRFAQVDTRFAEMGKLIERQTNKLILWSFAFWATTLLSIAALISRSGR